MESNFPWILIGIISVIGFFLFIIIMVLWPEWVGITGKKALQNEQSHRGEAKDEATDALSKLQGD